uniref:Uncharacterized protein n=1 Tax=Nelumbo nucifera TaxID=4432 RepID=A0A822ZFY4_NELNU|nr:TPA_asm: hypothetical protein HUJ06_001640 [Nelumbo nucifera]
MQIRNHRKKLGKIEEESEGSDETRREVEWEEEAEKEREGAVGR